ncbi:MAG: CsbD family protein [Methylotenera sp.]|nr:CsbD family protein [Oligoflexia bacterium]
MNENIIKGKWTEIKGEIQKAWGNLSHDEIEKNKANLTSIAGLIQQKYGTAQEEVKTRLHEIVARFSDEMEARVEKDPGVQAHLARATEKTDQVKAALKN